MFVPVLETRVQIRLDTEHVVFTQGIERPVHQETEEVVRDAACAELQPSAVVVAHCAKEAEEDDVGYGDACDERISVARRGECGGFGAWHVFGSLGMSLGGSFWGKLLSMSCPVLSVRSLIRERLSIY